MESYQCSNVTKVGKINFNRKEETTVPSNLISRPVLVLSQAFEPLNICSAKRAMKLIVKGAARMEETHPQLFYSGKMWDEYTGDLVTVDFFLPSVIRLLQYRYIPIRTPIVTRKNILNRDKNRCMYCGDFFPAKALTLDHVLPRSRGGKSTWENLVACCMPCNKKKDNKLLSELKDMQIINQPKGLNSHSKRFILRNMGGGDPLWEKYLFFDNLGEENEKWKER